jgi:hypothetical protein
MYLSSLMISKIIISEWRQGLDKKGFSEQQRRHTVIKFLFRAEAHQNEFCLSTPGLKARVIHKSTL